MLGDQNSKIAESAALGRSFYVGVVHSEPPCCTDQQADVGQNQIVVATPGRRVAMGTRKRRSDRAGRGILRSPGRPGVARREDRRRFWAAIAAGLASEDAARRASVSPAVGARWFREAGGMPPAALAPL